MKRVRWEIDVQARTPREAARKALEIQRDPESIATVFDVMDRGKMVRIDLPAKQGRYTVVGIDPPGSGSNLRDDTWVAHVIADNAESAWRRAIRWRLRVRRDLRADDQAILAVFPGHLTDQYHD